MLEVHQVRGLNPLFDSVGNTLRVEESKICVPSRKVRAGVLRVLGGAPSSFLTLLVAELKKPVGWGAPNGGRLPISTATGLLLRLCGAASDRPRGSEGTTDFLANQWLLREFQQNDRLRPKIVPRILAPR